MRKLFVAMLCCIAWPTLAANVVFETTQGNFTVELNEEKAPITVANFLRYVKDGSYEGSQFHRVIAGFMAQGGGFDADLNRLATYAPIRNEASNGLNNDVATIAMARTSDPHSASRQFFVNLQDNDFLNYSARNDGYAVFGKVTQGFEVIQSMAMQPTGTRNGMRDVPVAPIVVNKVTLQK